MAMIAIKRRAQRVLKTMLARSPAVILTGARQVGKSTLARQLASEVASDFYDLERGDSRQLFAEPGVELRRNPNRLRIIDEVQNSPELFSEIRTIIDELRQQGRDGGNFLLLGSTSGRLQRQSESLVGRVAELRLHPLDWMEIATSPSMTATLADWQQGDFAGDEKAAALLFMLDRGGYPKSLLQADSHRSWSWRNDYLLRTINRDALVAAPRVRADDYMNLLCQIAFTQGSVTPKETLARKTGKSSYITDAMLSNLEEMMLIRCLPAYVGQTAPRPAKSPKYYICDSGIFHCIINRQFADLGNRTRSAVWEGFAIENLIAAAPEGWRPHYFRTKAGKEVDLILVKPGGGIWAVEIKSGDDPQIGANLRGLVRHLKPERSFVVHGGFARLPSPADISILSLEQMMAELLAQDPLAERPAGRKQAAERAVLPESPELRQAVEAIQAGTRDLNSKRNGFMNHFIGQARAAVAKSSETEDSAACNVWIRGRDEFLAWLAAESLAVPTGPGAQAWRQRLTEALEQLGSLTTPSPFADFPYSRYGEFAQLCCYDIFVHAAAVLLKNRHPEEVGLLLGGDYYIHNTVVNSAFFWAADSKHQPEGRKPAVSEHPPGDFVSPAPDMRHRDLIEADLLLLLNGMVLGKKESGEQGGTRKEFLWKPWIFMGAKVRPPSSLFGRARGRSGMKELLACLDLAGTKEDAKFLKHNANRYLDKVLADKQRLPAPDARAILDFLSPQDWHDLG